MVLPQKDSSTMNQTEIELPYTLAHDKNCDKLESAGLSERRIDKINSGEAFTKIKFIRPDGSESTAKLLNSVPVEYLQKQGLDETFIDTIPDHTVLAEKLSDKVLKELDIKSEDLDKTRPLKAFQTFEKQYSLLNMFMQRKELGPDDAIITKPLAVVKLAEITNDTGKKELCIVKKTYNNDNGAMDYIEGEMATQIAVQDVSIPVYGFYNCEK